MILFANTFVSIKKNIYINDDQCVVSNFTSSMELRVVFLYLSGLVEPSMAELGGPAAARSITAAILLIAVEAPAKEEAIQFIVTLDQAQQAELAQIIQRLGEIHKCFFLREQHDDVRMFEDHESFWCQNSAERNF